MVRRPSAAPPSPGRALAHRRVAAGAAGASAGRRDRSRRAPTRPTTEPRRRPHAVRGRDAHVRVLHRRRPTRQATRGCDRRVRGGVRRHRRPADRAVRRPRDDAAGAAQRRRRPARRPRQQLAPVRRRRRRHERDVRRRLQRAVPAPARSPRRLDADGAVPRRPERPHDERPVHQRRRVQRGRRRDPDRVDVGRDGRRRHGGPGGATTWSPRSRSTSPATASARCSASSARR